MTNATAHGPAHSEPHAHAVAAAVHEQGQHHPLKVYFIVWGWLFVLSACSYLVDYVGLEGYLRWSLILIFMLLKAGLIVAVFMHMVWERRALACAILVPMFAVLVFIGIMAVESDYTVLTRLEFFVTAQE
jgi:cytochrome c oxidase subunit IV